MRTIIRCTLLFVLFGFLAAHAIAQTTEIKIGIIGTDTSHVPAFTKLLNDKNDPNHIPGARVVAAYKGGSADVESSRTRVDRFAEEIQQKYGVELVNSIEELCQKVDAVLLESVDGRPHLNQVRPVLKAGKRVFIDKPFATNYADAREIGTSRKRSMPTPGSNSICRARPESTTAVTPSTVTLVSATFVASTTFRPSNL